MIRKQVPILGIDQQSKDFYAGIRGTSLGIDGLRPVGNNGEVNWELITDVESLFTTSAFEIAHLSVNQTEDESTPLNGPSDIFFKPDGLKMYVSEIGADRITEYTLSTAWDLSTATVSDTYTPTASGALPGAVHVSSDGVYMMILGTNLDRIAQYEMSTPWDLTTISFNGSNILGGTTRGMWWRSDGLKVFIIDNDTIDEYDVSVAWDYNSGNYTAGSTIDLSSIVNQCTGIWLTDDGLTMYLTDNSEGELIQFRLSTAWDVSTATLVNRLNTSTFETGPYGFFYRANGEEMYMAGFTTENIYKLTALNIKSSYFYFDRWYYLLAGNSNIRLISQQNPGESNETSTVLFDYDINTLLGLSSGTNVVDTVSWAIVNNRLFVCVSSDTYNFNYIWSIYENTAYANTYKPKLPTLEVTVNLVNETVSDFDAKFNVDRKAVRVVKGLRDHLNQSSNTRFNIGNSGARRIDRKLLPGLLPPESGSTVEVQTYPGILRNKDKYIGIIIAWKHPNGQWVKHSMPAFRKIPIQTNALNTNRDYATLTFSVDSSYTDNDTNYDANTAWHDDYQFPPGGSTFEDDLLERGVFITDPKETMDLAVIEGTYFLIGTLDDDDALEWKENEETIPTGQVLNIDEYSHHVQMSKVIKEYQNNLLTIQSVTNFALPGWEWHSMPPNSGNFGLHSILPKINETVGQTITDPSLGAQAKASNEDCVVRVEIDTDKGAFYRWNKVSIAFYNNVGTRIIYLPGFLSYPDNRAKSLSFYWYDSGSQNYELITTINLKPHPFLNLGYSFGDVESTLQCRRIEYTPSSFSAINFDTDNDKVYVEENEFKISDLTGTYFPLTRSYQVSDEIQNIIDNSDSPGEERFGNYPIYILCKDNIFAGQASESAVIAKIDKLVNGLGVRTRNAYEVYRNTLFFISNSGVHALRGSNVDDVYDTIEDYKIQTIQSDNSLVETDAYAKLFSATDVYLGANHKTREILFGADDGNTIFVFNEKHKQWYTYNILESGSIANNLKGIFRIGSQAYYFINRELFKWGGAENQTGRFSIVSNPIVLEGYSVPVRIKTSVLQGFFDIASGGTLKCVLQGKRTTNNAWITLSSYDESGTIESFNSFYLKSNKGSMQAFRILVDGKTMNKGSYVTDLLIDYLVRARSLKK